MENENSKKDNDGKTLKVSVKQFCASCGYKRVRNDGTRYCKRRRRRVKQKGVCQYWTLADMFRKLRIKTFWSSECRSKLAWDMPNRDKIVTK